MPEAGDYGGTLSLWARGGRGAIEECDQQVEDRASKNDWKEAIEGHGGSDMLLYSDSSRDVDRRVGRGWYSPRFGGRSGYVGTCVGVLDEEVLGMRIAVEKPPKVELRLLSDSTAAISAVVKAPERGIGRTQDLCCVVDEVVRRVSKGL